MKLLILLCIFLVFVTACDNVGVDEDFVWRKRESAESEIMQAMRDAGYTGEHKLVRLDGFIGVDGDTRGSWSLFGGKHKGFYI